MYVCLYVLLHVIGTCLKANDIIKPRCPLYIHISKYFTVTLHTHRKSVFGIFSDGDAVLPHLMRPPTPECEVIQGIWREKLHLRETAYGEVNVQRTSVENYDREAQDVHGDGDGAQYEMARMPFHVNGTQSDVQGGVRGPHVRETLPIDEYKDSILGCIASSSVTCVHGETGCGKSSMVCCVPLA
jgi:hypothetical protein